MMFVYKQNVVRPTDSRETVRDQDDALERPRLSLCLPLWDRKIIKKSGRKNDTQLNYSPEFFENCVEEGSFRVEIPLNVKTKFGYRDSNHFLNSAG